MTTEKRKHLAAWFSIIFIFVTLASLFYIVKEEIINAQEKTVMSVRVFKTFFVVTLCFGDYCPLSVRL